MIKNSLVTAGYTSVKGFADGQDAWDYIAGALPGAKDG